MQTDVKTSENKVDAGGMIPSAELNETDLSIPSFLKKNLATGTQGGSQQE